MILTPPSLRRAAVALVALLALAATGCGGSTVAPSTAAAANAAAAGGLLVGQAGPADQAPGSDPAAPVTGAQPTAGPSSSTGEVVDPDQPAGTPGGASVPGASDDAPATPTGGKQPAAGTGIKRGSCAGLKAQTGITGSTITLGNATDLSGPIPGLFTSAQLGAKAYVAYFNATNPNGICGRKLALSTKDTRTDAGADNQAATDLCTSTFAAIGSLAVFDAGGARTTQKCGYPDVRAFATQGARNDCTTCFGVQSIGSDTLSTAIFGYWRAKQPAATQKAALVYINAGAAVDNARIQLAVGKKLGMKWAYTAAVDVADFNYGPYVQQMKSKGVKFAYFIGAYQQSVRMAQAMQQADFRPTVNYYSPGVYDPGFIKTGGSAVEGATLYVNFTPLEEHQRELDLYKAWLAQVSPGSEPSYYGIFGWSAGKLFVEKALALGGRLTRPSLIASLKATSGWTGGGMHAAMSVGSKLPPSCIRFLKVQGGKFVPADSGKYTCSGITHR